mmetsp:Transcript_44009/g.110228  ORF Transcript_44009/g.110228 Transcript_44009/m.110228 type:complete len:203 (+) Transcript_44009:18-626(+)
MVYGTFEGEAAERRSRAGGSAARLVLAFGCAAAVVGMVALVAQPKPSALLGGMDRNDGTDALVNAILVARGDSMPTKFVADRLNIDPQLPFRGSSAYHAPKRNHLKAHKTALYQRIMFAQKRGIMLAGSGSGSGSGSTAGAVLDPTTQFCADAADCARNNQYFKDNAMFHQAAHDMTLGINGPAMPANLPEYAWCPDTDPDC